ncbi:unnamed protein product [Hermetia illucens]|uniref:Uncharacterized protein n=1 Tax=Hermetia illucens TaxID=343691 RepID=A0A7R8UIX3_HERIL|nr:unnamed protein product [Hermetia illucens]
MKFVVVLLAVIAAAVATPILPLASIAAPIAPVVSIAPAAIDVAPLAAIDPILPNVAIAPAVAPLSLGLDAWAAPAVVDLWRKKRTA